MWYICEKTFSDGSTLVNHKKIHIGIKTFECDTCKKTFSVRSSLARHEKIHTGEKPYQCDICKKTFSENGGLNKHKEHIQIISQINVIFLKWLFSKE